MGSTDGFLCAIVLVAQGKLKQDKPFFRGVSISSFPIRPIHLLGNGQTGQILNA